MRGYLFLLSWLSWDKDIGKDQNTKSLNLKSPERNLQKSKPNKETWNVGRRSPVSDAPEEFTAEQGIQQDEEIRKTQKESKARGRWHFLEAMRWLSNWFWIPTCRNWRERSLLIVWNVEFLGKNLIILMKCYLLGRTCTAWIFLDSTLILPNCFLTGLPLLKICGLLQTFPSLAAQTFYHVLRMSLILVVLRYVFFYPSFSVWLPSSFIKICGGLFGVKLFFFC